MIRRTLFFLVCLISFATYSPLIISGFPMGMGQEEDFMKELEEANRVIEEWLASQSPEVQEDFNREVEAATRMFEGMSDEEFKQFVDSMFADEGMMEPAPFPEVQQTPQEEVVEVVLSAEDKKKAETALSIIDDVIKQSNLFMVIVNSSADAPSSINRWGAKGDIAHWQAGATWDSFKTELESFINKLYKIEEQDIATKKYKYLLEFISDEALYNNLIQVQTELKKLLPIINIPEFSIQKLTPEIKNTLKAILSKYTESFYLLTIPASLDTLIQKYAPEEEKIKLAEEAATKRASDAARATRIPAREAQAGTEPYDDYDSGYSGGYGDYGYGGGYGDYGYGGGYGDYGYGGGRGGYGSDSRGGGSRGGSGSGMDTEGSGGTPGSRATKESDDEKKDKDKKKKKDGELIPNFEIERLLGSTKELLDAIKTAMAEDEENPTKLAHLVEHVTKDEKVDETLASYILPTVVDKKITVINENLTKIAKKLEGKKITEAHRKHYRKEIGKLFDDYSKPLKNLRDALNTFITSEEMEELKKTYKEEEINKVDVSTLPAAKQWAFFGGTAELTGENEELKDKIISPVSLLDVKKNINDLFKSLDKLSLERKQDALKENDPQAIIPANEPVFEEMNESLE